LDGLWPGRRNCFTGQALTPALDPWLQGTGDDDTGERTQHEDDEERKTQNEEDNLEQTASYIRLAYSGLDNRDVVHNTSLAAM